MADEKHPNDEEIRKLRARIVELEQENKRIKADASPPGSRTEGKEGREDRRSAFGSISQTKGEVFFRTARSFTLAWVEGLRSLADSFAAVAEDVLDANRPVEDESVQSLNARLGSDVANSVASVTRSWADIPARAADKFSNSYREGHFQRRRSRREQA